MDSIDALAHAIRLPLEGLRRIGFGPAAHLSDGALRGTAHSLGCALLGTLWQVWMEPRRGRRAA